MGIKANFFVLVPFLFLWGIFPLSGQGIKPFVEALDWSVRGSVLFFPEDNGNASAPMPILPSLGGGVSYNFNNLLALEFSLDIYGNTYDYDYRLRRAVPANDEFRSSFVIGTLWALQPVFRFRPPGDKCIIRVYGGPAADLRICLLAYGVEGSESHTNSIGPTGHTVAEASREVSAYFWGGGRWFLPFAGGGMDFPFYEKVLLGFDIRFWFPVYRLWTGEDLPAVEGFRIGAGFRVSF